VWASASRSSDTANTKKPPSPSVTGWPVPSRKMASSEVAPAAFTRPPTTNGERIVTGSTNGTVTPIGWLASASAGVQTAPAGRASGVTISAQ